VVIHANLMVTDKINNTFLATDKPHHDPQQDKDSIYIRADTFFSGGSRTWPTSKQAFIADSLHSIMSTAFSTILGQPAPHRYG